VRATASAISLQELPKIIRMGRRVNQLRDIGRGGAKCDGVTVYLFMSDRGGALYSVQGTVTQSNSVYVTDGNIMYLTDASRFLISCVIQHYAPVAGWGGGGRNRCIMLIMTLDPGDKH
jgi:hypothetical protein